MVLMDLIDEHIEFYILKLYITALPYQVSVPFVTRILVAIVYFGDLNHLVVFFFEDNELDECYRSFY